VIRRAVLGVALFSIVAVALAAQQGVAPGGGAVRGGGSSDPPSANVLRITSPLGRTGLVTRVRIVAQISVAPGVQLSPVEFFVDGTRVGIVQNGPPYAVEWLDENAFEKREILVQANTSAGEILRDTVSLPPFEVVEKTEVTGVLVETSVFDKNGRFVSDLPGTAFTITEDDVQQKIDFISRESVETDMVLLVDNSQSMSRRMDYVRGATERLIASLREKDRAIVAPFNAHVGNITGPTNDVPTLKQAIDDHPELAKRFMEFLLLRNSQVEADLVDQLFNSSEKRVARLLILLSRVGHEAELIAVKAPISQEIMAARVGTTRPRINYFLNKFRKLGLIEYNGELKVHSSLVNIILRE